jgi:hypothetical protein
MIVASNPRREAICEAESFRAYPLGRSLLLPTTYYLLPTSRSL